MTRSEKKFRVTDDMIVPYAQRPQSFAGVTVIMRQPALVPHPHPSQGGRFVPTRGVTQVLLENGHEMFECDICLATRDNGRSVVSHLVSHSPASQTPEYPMETIKLVLRVCVEERAQGFRNYAVRVAERLNAGAVVRSDGLPWSPSQVSALWRSWSQKFPELARPSRARRATAVVPTRTPAPTPTPTPTPTRSQAAARRVTRSRPTQDGADTLTHVSQLITRIEVDLTTLRDVITNLVESARDDREKAARYDTIMSHARRVAGA